MARKLSESFDIQLTSAKSTGVSTNVLHRAELRNAQIKTVEQYGVEPLAVKFQVVSREAAFTDTTIANYNIIGQGSSFARYRRNLIAKGVPQVRGELTTQFESITPKTLSFDIVFRADVDYPPELIKGEIIKLQSLCYPRAAILLNPPLCRLRVLDLYSLECYVTQVLVTWTPYWNLRVPLNRNSVHANLPMGADVNMSVIMHQYPTREDVLAGSTFHTAGTGYAGTVGDANARIGRDGE